jgi:hypothetical protein
MNEAVIAKLTSPESCDKLARNLEAKGKLDLAVLARRRGIHLRAEKHGAQSAAEREAIQAVLAYEQALFRKHGRTVRASRTWDMIKRRGIIATVEHLVTRTDETMGYKAVIAMGLPEMAFEAVVIRHPQLFTLEALQRARERLEPLGFVAR